MKASEIQDLLKATVLVGPLPQEEILTACGSDMMSDVLAFPKDRMVLLTGLTNPHTVRTAELLDVMMLIFVRGKQPNEEVLNMAEDAGIAVIMTEYTLYDACGRLYAAGLPGGTGRKKMSEIIHEIYPVEKGAFETAGEASGTIKRMLRKLGVPSPVIRRVSVASYEVELNLVIHSLGGQMEITIEPESVTLDVSDRGPGIPNLDLAMQEGWSTASDEVRMLGFGAGMGLPNMKRNADEFDIRSEVGVGTNIHMKFFCV